MARDRLGKKPLYYRHRAETAAVRQRAEEPAGSARHRRELDPQALDEYLTYQYVPHPRTILRGFAKLPPAHYGVFADGRWTVDRYWHPDFNRQIDRPLADYAAELRELLTSAVAMRLESDVPLGAFLSGGVDSSIVVGLMQRLSMRPVKTFSIGFADADYDETAYAREVAQRLGTEHHEFRVEPERVEVLEKLVWHYDEPFADSSAMPTYYVSKLSREHVTVALTGDGGDELFAGYLRYRAVRLAVAGSTVCRAVHGGRSASCWLHGLGRGGRQRSLVAARGPVGRGAAAIARRAAIWNGCRCSTKPARAELYSDAFLATLPDADPYAFLAEARPWPAVATR